MGHYLRGEDFFQAFNSKGCLRNFLTLDEYKPKTVFPRHVKNNLRKDQVIQTIRLAVTLMDFFSYMCRLNE